MADITTDTAATTETATTTQAETTTETAETKSSTTVLEGQQASQEVGAKETADTTEGEKQTETKDAEAKTGAPEQYEAFTVPEGITLDAAALESFTPIAKELNLTQEQAQQLVNLEAQRVASFQAAQAEAFTNQVATWAETAKADKEIGGQAFDGNVTAALAAMTRFGSPELKALMGLPGPNNPTGMGLGNHPELIRVFTRIGKAMAESTLHNGGTDESTTKSLGSKFYPGMNP